MPEYVFVFDQFNQAVHRQMAGTFVCVEAPDLVSAGGILSERLNFYTVRYFWSCLHEADIIPHLLANGWSESPMPEYR